MERCNTCGKLFTTGDELKKHGLSAHPPPVQVRDRIDLDEDPGGAVFNAIADVAEAALEANIFGAGGSDNSVGGDVGGDFSGGGGTFDGGGASGEF